MRRVQILTISLTLVLGSVAAALAQSVSATTGAINGKVTDRTAAVLPGVTVTISSPAMQGVRTATTSEDGSYRFPAVPPGDYKLFAWEGMERREFMNPDFLRQYENQGRTMHLDDGSRENVQIEAIPVIEGAQ